MPTGTYSRWMPPSSGGPNGDVLVTVEAAVAALDAVYLKSADLFAKADATAITTMPVAGFIVSKPSAITGLLR